jgi:catechol 2,3-dioxygenase
MTPLPSATAIGTVQLTVSDLDRSRDFYERALGLRPEERADGGIDLGAAPGEAAAGGPPLLSLRGDPSAPPVNPRLTGLFHFAVLVPSRRDLAVSLARLARSRWPLSGASDHLVSEALYLNDPDGNGIEIYRDRPRDEWRHDAGGSLQMATLPLDLDDVIGELADSAALLRGDLPLEERVPAGTRIGHVHLQVSELEETEAFYAGVLGFDVTVRGYPGALFVAAGGYHHHVGLNTWNSRGAPAPPPGALGLHHFEVRIPDESALAAAVERVRAAGRPFEPADGGTLVRDPSGNAVLLTR